MFIGYLFKAFFMLSDDIQVNIIAITIITLIILFILLKLFLFIEEIVIKIFHRNKSDNRRDAHRVYSSAIKEKYSQLCGNRCEGIGLVFRSKHEGHDLQGDHWYPYSRGGATTEKNLVMLCPKCNRKKTNHVPTFLQTNAIRFRRKHNLGYNNHTYRKPGEWLKITYRK